MVVYDGVTLPKEVSMAAGTVGMKILEIAEYRVGEDVVVILNKKGQKYTFDLLRLNPASPAAKRKRKPAARRSMLAALRSAPGVVEDDLFTKGGKR